MWTHSYFQASHQSWRTQPPAGSWQLLRCCWPTRPSFSKCDGPRLEHGPPSRYSHRKMLNSLTDVSVKLDPFVKLVFEPGFCALFNMWGSCSQSWQYNNRFSPPKLKLTKTVIMWVAPPWGWISSLRHFSTVLQGERSFAQQMFTPHWPPQDIKSLHETRLKVLTFMCPLSTRPHELTPPYKIMSEPTSTIGIRTYVQDAKLSSDQMCQFFSDLNLCQHKEHKTMNCWSLFLAHNAHTNITPAHHMVLFLFLLIKMSHFLSFFYFYSPCCFSVFFCFVFLSSSC